MPNIPNTSSPSRLDISQRNFGRLSNGEETMLFTLSNTDGVQVQISDYGGIIVSLETVDKYVGEVVESALLKDYDILVTADHDNDNTVLTCNPVSVRGLFSHGTSRGFNQILLN